MGRISAQAYANIFMDHLERKYITHFWKDFHGVTRDSLTIYSLFGQVAKTS